MSRINIFKSVLNSSLSSLISRNSDYNGYWLWGFVISKGKTISLHVDKPQSLSKDLLYLQKLTKQIVYDQIVKHGLASYVIKDIMLHFSSENNESIIDYPCKRIAYKTYIRLEVFLKEKCFSFDQSVYIASHNEKLESKRAI